MTVERLDASRFGFDSRCFVCDASNEHGLRVPFFHDVDRGIVFADFTLSADFSGAPTVLHGGVTLALIDEAMSWATIALIDRFAYTGETTTRFAWPVRVDRRYRVEAGVRDEGDRCVTTDAVVLDTKARPCVTATATMVVLDLEQATDAIGTTLSAEEHRYVRKDADQATS